MLYERDAMLAGYDHPDRVYAMGQLEREEI
jgi:hypothetical protein